MAHHEQREFCTEVRSRFPGYFVCKRVLDIGSLDVNGNNRYLFEGCDYVGIDVGEGPNVDITVLAHEFDIANDSFDVIISTECLEHDPFYKRTLQNAVRILKPAGLFLFTCATTGRPEHGTVKSDGGATSPLTARIESWADYYMNITEQDIHGAIPVGKSFERKGYLVPQRQIIPAIMASPVANNCQYDMRLTRVMLSV